MYYQGERFRVFRKKSKGERFGVFFGGGNLGHGTPGMVGHLMVIAKLQIVLVANRVCMARTILPVFWLRHQVLGSKWKMIHELSCNTCTRGGITQRWLVECHPGWSQICCFALLLDRR